MVTCIHLSGYTANQKWFEQMIDACLNTEGITCGLYSSHDEYKWIFGKYALVVR